MSTVRRLYSLTAVFAGIGFVLQFALAGPRNAFGFLIGGLASFGNLWMFAWLATSIAPGERTQKPWPASVFVGRYIVLVAVGYATVKALNVSPVAVLLGLLASTAAALTSAVLELAETLFGKRSQ